MQIVTPVGDIIVRKKFRPIRSFCRSVNLLLSSSWLSAWLTQNSSSLPCLNAIVQNDAQSCRNFHAGGLHVAADDS